MSTRKTQISAFSLVVIAVVSLVPVAQAETTATPPAGPFNAQQPQSQEWVRSLPMPYWMQPSIQSQAPVQDRQPIPQTGTVQQPNRQAPQMQGQPYRQNWAWTPFGTFTRTQPGGYYTPYVVGAPNQYYGYVPPSFPVPPFFPSGPWGGYRGPVGPGYGYQYGTGMPPRPQN